MINIVICQDKELYGKEKNLVNSIKANTKEDVNIILFRPEEDPLPQITDFHTSIVKSKAMFWRFLIPEVFPELDRYIYLECDSIVTADIKQLWDIDLKGKTVAMASDPFSHKLCDIMRFQGQVPTSDMFMLYNVDIDNTPTLLSGQMLVDAKRWKVKKYTQRLIEFVQKYKTADMIAINCVLSGDIFELDKKWSAPGKWLNKDEILSVGDHPVKEYKNSFLYHYHGKPKPWEGATYLMMKLWRKYD